MLSKELLSQIKNIQIKARHLVTNSMAGEYSSAFKGVGIEFEKVREYVVGDDIRTIDWNVMARTQKPHVKIFREEREQTLMLMVDVSPSQRFGTTSKFKNEIAAELTAVLAFLAIKNNDKVGLILFSDHVEHYIPPKKGRSHIWMIIRSVLTHEGSGKSTDIQSALSYLSQVHKRKSICFLISDFYADSYEKGLRHTKKRHEVISCHVRDEREELFPDCGMIELVDNESHEILLLDSGSAKGRAELQSLEQERCKQLKTQFQKQGIDLITVETHKPIVTPLLSYLRRRERRRR